MTIQWSVSRVRLLILCEILLAGCWWSLSLTSPGFVIIKFYINYQSEQTLFVGCTLVVMKSLSRQTNIICNHIIISGGRGHPIITSTITHFMSQCSPSAQYCINISTTTVLVVFLIFFPHLQTDSKSTPFPLRTKSHLNHQDISPNNLTHN